MQGMCRNTGKWLNATDHIKQSVIDIMTTRKGSRLLRRNYGGLLPELIDRPMQPSFIAQYAVAVAQDIDEWDPRVSLKNLSMIEGDGQGQGRLKLILEYEEKELELFV